MRANTLIMIVLACVFGVLAVVLANIWLANQRSAMAQTDNVKRDTVVVAAVALKFGDTLTADKLQEIAWPAGAVPAGAFKTVKDLLAGQGSKQALQTIGVNEPVLAGKITGPGQRATLSAVLGEGMKAVSIRVNDVLGVAGFVFPGDRVDILLTRTTQDSGNAPKSFVDVLLQSVKVLAVDQVADESKDSPTVVKAVTVEVNTKDAQKLTLAAGAGQLSLALRQAAAGNGESTERVTLSDLTGDTPEDVAKRQAELDRQKAADAAAADERKRANEKIDGLAQAVERVGSQIDQLSKVKPAPAVAPAPQVQEVVKEVVKYVQPEPPARATIGVFRGVKLETYDVPRQR
ncbi:Flp pilus assembly protein CpaB [Mesorhizobium sp. M2D.F.Ca.ET.185.01.1.1]|uniref:Flp pilus assembly protein CpaB n=1 Tax=unclassified Mesorhizobium TaxID=325217 RepID=UPI000FCA5BCD|nr:MULTISPECIES: Flp pilus assembly protein CpaB [unclassified Mesorhizobium]TGP74408.1 Flp pilus assembly protein CpaB [bacterium M00.F.Ca.ET.227.01.1.1]TGP85094.1 Flp pilus assembly protein CpaB [bacterium M00.F.Ca.ET.221.01.1.1]TGP89177.1 Flp pilus assembly protein CpaB [bacterium M00.F.Ca.ET.222.01.1.1]TGU12750.1 Flp pilus assembly protein CpaB [bacterium M00.F.Ca.ET.163.01.1.1]TGU21332.1 Flp pilus assembly protein CpaB [bacterium M00.F.Ca.ET.156.01.1.1]TGU43743.1 Flp pilus assembly prote